MQPQDPMYPPARPTEPGDQPSAMPESWQPPHTPQTSQTPPAPAPQPVPYGTPYKYVDPTPQLPQPLSPTYSSPAYAPGTAAGSPPHAKSRRLIVALTSLFALVAVVGAGYFLYTQYGPDSTYTPPTDMLETEQAERQQSQQRAVKTTAASSLQSLTILPPVNLSRFKANPDNTNTAMTYTTVDDSCSIALGVVDNDLLPGKNIDAMAAGRIQQLKDTGATVDEPRKTDNFIIADSTDSKMRYHLESRTFIATEQTKQTRYLFSAAILKDGKRAYVIRSCTNPNGAVDDAALTQLEADAASIALIAKQ